MTALRDEFRAHHSAYMPGLLDATLVKSVIEGMRRGTWIGHEHEGLAREVILEDVRTLDLLHFVANAPAFLARIREVTGCDAITRFEGRVYRMIPGTDHFDSWHSDAGAHRMVGMSVNLGPHPYEGGTLQLRTRGEHAVVRKLPNTVPGGAILFRISPVLSHRVTPVTGTEPKTAFAGWFLADGSEYFATLLGAARKQHARSLSEG
ncbi:MAG: 2OG-Fe(II) oxygenase [Acidobacteria bacterium]|nr:2OG-Fe(II) oxygenase [Acidobacteriota bacterium]